MRHLASAVAPGLARCREFLDSPHWRESIYHKSSIEIATACDVLVDEVMREDLEREFPGMQVVSEESSPHLLRQMEADCLVVDPIDGTKMLVQGSPLFSISIALLLDGRIAESVVDFPALGFRISAAKGNGLELQGRATHIKREPNVVAVSPWIA